jgi:hypothetical protein
MIFKDSFVERPLDIFSWYLCESLIVNLLQLAPLNRFLFPSTMISVPALEAKKLASNMTYLYAMLATNLRLLAIVHKSQTINDIDETR